MKRRWMVLAGGLAVVLAALGGCAQQPTAGPAGDSGAVTGAGEPREVEIMAAASLTEALNEFEIIFEQMYPGVEVLPSYASTSTVRFQIEQGATPEIFGSANEKHAKALEEGGYLDGGYRAIAHNAVGIIVPKENKANIRNVGDLAKPGLILVVCAEEVPIGNYTRQVLDKVEESGDFGNDYRAKVEANFRSLEPTVKGIVTKVITGEADAGIVYTSDITPAVAAEVQAIKIPAEYNVLVNCYAAVVNGCEHPDLAHEMVDYMLSAEGQAIFEKYGFVFAAKDTQAE